MNLKQFEEMKRPTMKLEHDQVIKALDGLQRRINHCAYLYEKTKERRMEAIRKKNRRGYIKGLNK